MITLSTTGVQHAFSKAATRYDEVALVQQRSSDNLLARLDWIRGDKHLILDAGCGTGRMSRALQTRYPEATVIGIDFAPGMIAYSKALDPTGTYLLADVTHLPFQENSVDVVISNCTYQWTSLAKTFREAFRVLKPDGIFLCALFGPDTLTELRQSFAAVDDAPHVHVFLDMHDVGDALLQAGFHDPVMDNQRLTLMYQDVMSLCCDLRDLGASNQWSDRRKSLTGKTRFARMMDAYARFKQDAGYPASFELVYGYARKPEDAQPVDPYRII